ncbi:MAG: hypothetical protein M0D57_04420 [Sphingobacteriales bacterium JAD_PAG50586_3]|nr:MAG: hypothetical protein M0D57_04420 [Sphingobacteriales bacterium JAD_PAG50586_3]
MLSHQDIITSFYIINLKKDLPVLGNSIPINIANLDNYGLPRVITLFLEKNGL